MYGRCRSLSMSWVGIQHIQIIRCGFVIFRGPRLAKMWGLRIRTSVLWASMADISKDTNINRCKYSQVVEISFFYMQKLIVLLNLWQFPHRKDSELISTLYERKFPQYPTHPITLWYHEDAQKIYVCPKLVIWRRKLQQRSMDAIFADFRRAYEDGNGYALSETLSPIAPSSDPTRLHDFIRGTNHASVKRDIQYRLLYDNSAPFRLPQDEGHGWVEIYCAYWRAICEVLNAESSNKANAKVSLPCFSGTPISEI